MWVQVNRLGMVVGVERSLEDPCREDDAVLSGHVVGIDCGRSHAPPGGRVGPGERGEGQGQSQCRRRGRSQGRRRREWSQGKRGGQELLWATTSGVGKHRPKGHMWPLKLFILAQRIILIISKL